MNEDKTIPEEQFIDAEAMFLTGKEKLNFQLIALLHLKKITTLCTVEWHGGYFNEKTFSNYTEKFYIMNSRDCFWNAIFCLYDLCYPYFDKEMKEADKVIQKELTKLPDAKIGKASQFNPRMDCMRKLFRELSCFLKRADYFKTKQREE